jgi:hypothetical protein
MGSEMDGEIFDGYSKFEDAAFEVNSAIEFQVCDVM